MLFYVQTALRSHHFASHLSTSLTNMAWWDGRKDGRRARLGRVKSKGKGVFDAGHVEYSAGQDRKGRRGSKIWASKFYTRVITTDEQNYSNFSNDLSFSITVFLLCLTILPCYGRHWSSGRSVFSPSPFLHLRTVLPPVQPRFLYFSSSFLWFFSVHPPYSMLEIAMKEVELDWACLPTFSFFENKSSFSLSLSLMLPLVLPLL